MTYTAVQAYELSMIALCVWREARGESSQAQLGVAYVICNRAKGPKWYGGDIVDVVIKPYQFSSFNAKDPNAVKWPTPTDPSFLSCLAAAEAAYITNKADPTDGALAYFDKSLDANPPVWAKTLTPTITLGALHFYK